MNDKTIGGGGKEVIILAIDTGTTETGYCILEADTYKPQFKSGKPGDT